MFRRFAVLALVVVLTACAKEKPVAPDALPAPVAGAIQARFPGSKVIEASREKEKDKLLYDVELEHQGRRLEVEIDPNGGIVQIEAPIALHELPAEAARALEQRYPNEQVREVEQKTEVVDGQDKVVSYEVRLVTSEKKALEVEVTPDGRILAEEPDATK